MNATHAEARIQAAQQWLDDKLAAEESHLRHESTLRALTGDTVSLDLLAVDHQARIEQLHAEYRARVAADVDRVLRHREGVA